MGDNVYLGDRDSVRTPMQWAPDRNGGFSSADFERLVLPPIMDPVHGFQAVNVEAERRDPSSFLHWLRRMLQVRRQYPVLATGEIRMLSADNPSVLAFVREDGEAPAVLSLNNLSRFAQPVQLSLPGYEGATPVELLGRVPFPAVAGGLYLVTLPPYGFYWFELRRQEEKTGRPAGKGP
jgi:maltose alpha-D-glucosyltransferase/alpha-amylase